MALPFAALTSAGLPYIVAHPSATLTSVVAPAPRPALHRLHTRPHPRPISAEKEKVKQNLQTMKNPQISPIS
jgi:hypothetical protein